MKSKKIVSGILAAALAFCSVNAGLGTLGTAKGAAAYAADADQSSFLSYKELDDGTLEVSCQSDYKEDRKSVV